MGLNREGPHESQTSELCGACWVGRWLFMPPTWPCALQPEPLKPRGTGSKASRNRLGKIFVAAGRAVTHCLGLPILWIINLRMAPGTQVSGNYMELIRNTVKSSQPPDQPAGEGRGGRESAHTTLEALRWLSRA